MVEACFYSSAIVLACRSINPATQVGMATATIKHPMRIDVEMVGFGLI